MFSRAFTLCGLLALTSAGLLTPSNVYLPASSSQQSNALSRTSYTIPAVVTASQQIPTVSSAIYQQTPAVSAVYNQQVPAVSSAIHQQIPAVSAVYNQQIPAVFSAIHQQIPTVRNNVVNTAQHTYTAGASTVFQQYPQSAQQVTVHAKSSQPIQIQSVNAPSVYQQVPSIASQQVPSTRQSNFGVQQVSSSVNTNALLRSSQPAHTNAAAIPSFHSASFQQVPIKQIAIVRLANENVGDGTYNYNYETENGIAAQEHGQANIAGAETVERVQGSYSYTGPDGVRYTVNYVADENGYRAEGAHLPVPPEPVAPVSQVTSRASQINSNAISSQSDGVHVIPTTVISQPLQIVQNPGIQSQRQAAAFRSSYFQQSPVVQSSQNIFRQATVVPSSNLNVYQGPTGFTNQQVSADSLQNQNNQASSSVTVQLGSTGSSYEQGGAVQAQVLQRQTTFVPNSVTVQSSAPNHNAVSESVQHGVLRQSAVVVPASTVTVQHGSSQQSDAIQTQVLQKQSTVVPSTVTVQNGGAASHTGVSETVEHGVLRQSAVVVPASTVSVQHGTTGYSTQQIGVGSFSAQLSGLQRQASAVQQGAEYNTQQSGQQAFQIQQDVAQNQNTVAFGFVSAQQGAQVQQPLVQNLIAPSNSDSVQQGTTSEQSGVVSVVQSSAVPSSTVSAQRGFAANNVYSSVQQSQAAVPSGVVQVQLGRTGLISQRNNVQAQQATQRQGSGASSSHVTVQLGSAGYATEQVGDISSVQVFGGSSDVPTQTLTNIQQVSQQAGVSSNVVPSTVNEQQTTSSNHETTISQEVVLPDGSVHNGY